MAHSVLLYMSLYRRILKWTMVCVDKVKLNTLTDASLWFVFDLTILGAFLIPYLIMLAFAGMPIFFMEVILGQWSGVGPNKLFELAPLFKGI